MKTRVISTDTLEEVAELDRLRARSEWTWLTIGLKL